jgi:hypothetical protein
LCENEGEFIPRWNFGNYLIDPFRQKQEEDFMEEAWQCPKCGATNTSGQSACIICKTARPAPEVQVSTQTLPTAAPAAAAAPSRGTIRSVSTRAVVTGHWTTNVALEQAQQQVQGLVSAAQLQMESRSTLDGVEIVGTRGLGRMVRGLKFKETEAPLRASIRLSNTAGGTAVEATFEETWARLKCQSSVYVARQNAYDGYFRQWLYSLGQALPAVPGSPVSIQPAMPLAQIPVVVCENCGKVAPTQFVSFNQNIGAIVLRFYKHIDAYLCKSCIKVFFKKYTLTTLFLGWWGIISFFFTPFILLSNIITYNGTSQLGESLDSTGFVPLPAAQTGLSFQASASGAAVSQPGYFPPGAQPVKPAAKPKRPGRGRLVIGIVAGVLGALILILFTLIQLTGPNGPGDNLTGFFGTLAICPLPLLLVGLGLGFSGFFVRRKAAREAASGSGSTEGVLQKA